MSGVEGEDAVGCWWGFKLPWWKSQMFEQQLTGHRAAGIPFGPTFTVWHLLNLFKQA